MLMVMAIFTILIIYDFQKFIRKKEQARVFVINIFIMAASMSVSLLMAAGRRPYSPSQWVEALLNMIGVLK